MMAILMNNMNKMKLMSNKINVVAPDISGEELTRVLKQIHDAAMAIAQDGEEDGLCEMDAG